MNYSDQNRRTNNTTRNHSARSRIMSPHEKVQRDQLLENRERLKQSQQNPQEKPSRKQQPPPLRRKQRKFVLEKFHLWATFLGLIILVLSVNLLTFVQGIQVKNNENASSKDIIAWATEDTLSFNGLYIWYKINHTEIDYPVSIVDARVSFQNPWTLTIRVTEKEILGGIVLNDGYAYFDQEGQVLLITQTMQDDIRLIDGIETIEVLLYESIITKNQEAFKNLLQVMQLIKKYEVQVDEIIPSEDNSISLIIGETTVTLGNSDYESKVHHITPILERLEEKEGILYLDNFDGDNGTITFK